MKKKRCTKCGALKPLNDFGMKGANNKNSPHESQRTNRYRRPQCRDCERAYHREYYARTRGRRTQAPPRRGAGGPRVSAEALIRYVKRNLFISMSLGELCEMLAGRSRWSPAVWARRWDRMISDRTIGVYQLDEFCIALGLHLSDLDSYYDEVSA